MSLRTTILCGMLLSSAFLLQGADNSATITAEQSLLSQKSDADTKTDASIALELDVFVVPNNMKTMGQMRNKFFSDTQVNRIEKIFGKLSDEEVCVEVVLVDPSQKNPVQLAFDGTNPNFRDSDKVLPMYLPRSRTPDEGKMVQFLVNNRVLNVTGRNLKYKYYWCGTMQQAIATLRIDSYSPPVMNAAQDNGDEKSAPAGSSGS